MAKYSNVIEYKVKTVLDGTGLSKLQAELAKTENMLQSWSSKKMGNPHIKEWEASVAVLEKVRGAINRAYNSDIKALNISKFNKELEATEFKAKGIGTALSNAGVVGQKAFNSLIARTASLDTGLKNINSTATKLATTFKNTVRWGLSASLFEGFMSGVHEALEYVKDLDRSLNDIRIVSGYSAEYMRDFAREANEAAVALGKTTTAYTDASLIYIQQGKTLEESKKLAELTLKTANVTGQETAEVSEQLTALMNGYQVAVDDMEASVDKLAKVAAVGASDMEELATAASRVSSTANALGVSQDQLIAQLSTIISVTRLAPETVGNSLKTIFARLGDLKMGETLEDGVDMGSIGKTLDLINIKITDTSGELRNMGDVLEELMVKWDDLSTAEQQAVAVKLAGKYQYNNLIALLENAEMYHEQLEASETSLGTINEQQQIYLESLEAKLESLSSSFEGLISSVFNPDDMKPFLDVLTNIIKLTTQFTDSIGGGATLIAGLSGIATKTFGNTIAKDVVRHKTNKEQQLIALNNADATQALIDAFGVDGGSKVSRQSLTYQYAKDNARYYAQMDDEQRAEYKASLQEYAERENSREDIYKNSSDAVSFINRMARLADSPNVIGIDENYKLTIDQGQYDEVRAFFEDQLKTGKYAEPLVNQINGVTRKPGEKYLIGSIADISGVLSNDLKPLVEKRSMGEELSSEEQQLLTSTHSSISGMLKTFKRDMRDAFQGYEGSELGDELNKVYNSFRNVSALHIDEGVEQIDKFSLALDKLLDRLSAVTNKAQQVSQDVKKEADSSDMPDADDLRLLFDESAAATQSKEQDLLKMQQETERRMTQERVAQYVSIAGAVQQMAAAYMAFKNIGSIWSDEDLSIGDKLLQTFMSIAPAIMMATDAVRTFREAMATLDEINSMQPSGNSGDKIELGGKVTGKGLKGRLGNLGKSASKFGANLLKGGTRVLPVLGELLIVFDVIKGIVDKAEEARQKATELKREAAETAEQKYDEIDADYQSMESLKEDYDETGIASDAFVGSLRALGEELDIQETESLLAAGAYDELAEKVKKAREEAQEEWLEANNEYIDAIKGDAFKVLGDYNEEQRKSDVYQFGDLISSLLNSIKDTLFNISQSSIWKSIDEFITKAKEFFNSIGKWFDTLFKFPGEILGNLAFMLADLTQGAGWNQASDALVNAGNSLLGTNVKKVEYKDYVGEYLQDNSEESSAAKVLQASFEKEGELYGKWSQSRVKSIDEYTAEVINQILASSNLDQVVDASVFTGAEKQIQDYLSTLTQEQVTAINKAFVNAGYDAPFIIDEKVLNDFNPRIEVLQDKQREQKEVPTSNADKVYAMLDAASASRTSSDSKRAFADTFEDILFGVNGDLLYTGNPNNITDDIAMGIAQGLMDSGIVGYNDLSEILSSTYVPTAYDDTANDLIEQRNAEMMAFNPEVIEAISNNAKYEYDADMAAAMARDEETARLRVMIAEAEGKKNYEAGLAYAQEQQERLNQSSSLSYAQQAQEQLKNAGSSNNDGNDNDANDGSSSQKSTDTDVLNNLFGARADSNASIDLVNSISDIGELASSLGIDSDDIVNFAEAIDNDDYYNQIAHANSALEQIDNVIDVLEDRLGSEDLSEIAKYNIEASLGEIKRQREELSSTFDNEALDALAETLFESTSAYVQKFFAEGTFDKNSSTSITEQVRAWLQNELGLADGETNDVMKMFLALTDNGMMSAEALEYLTKQAIGAGDTEAAANIQRQNYEKNVVDNDQLVSMMSKEADVDANSFYSNVVARAMERGGHADWDTVASVVQYLDGDIAQAMRLMETNLIDITRDFNTYSQELDEFFSGGKFNRWRDDDIFNTNKEGVKNLVSAQQNDEITGEIISASGIDKDVASVFEAVSGQSDALSDALALTTNQSFEAQRAVIELGDTYQRYEYGEQIEDIQKTRDEIADVEREISNLNKQGLDISVDGKSIEELQDELDDLKEQLNDEEFKLDINVAGDMLDKADQTIEAIKDIQNAIDLIGEDYTVDASSLEALVKVFPDILDNASVTADGLIQLDQQIVDSALSAAQSEVDAAIGTDSVKLESAITYAGAMAEQYQTMASAYATMAANEALTDEELTQTQADFDQQLSQIKADNAEAVDQATSDALQNQADNITEVSQVSQANSQQASQQAISNLGAIGVQSGQVASQVIENAQRMWASIASIGTESFVGGSGDTGLRSTGTVGVSTVSGSMKDSSGSSGSFKGGSNISGGSAQDNAAKLAADAQAKADAWNQIQGMLQSKLLSLGSAGTQLGGGIGSGSGSGGSGGGGGGSEYDPKTKEYQEDEIDRYEKVDTLLDAITADYEKLNAEQERLIGFDLADNITKQIYLLRQQIDLQKEKLGIQKEEAEEYRKELADRFGVQFNDDGFITNYAERYKSILGTLNDLITVYNNTATEEGQEALEEQIDFAQETYDDFVDLIDKYDEMISSTIKDTERQLEDLEDEIEDLNISMFQKAVEATDNIKELNEALIDFNAAFSGLDSDNPFREMETSAKKLAGYFDVATDKANDYYDTLAKRYKELMEREGVSDSQKSFYGQQIAQLEEARRVAGQGSMEQFGTGYLDLSLMSVASIAEQIRQFEENGISEIFGKDSADLYDTAKDVFEQATDLVADYEGEIDSLRDAIVSAIDDIAERIEERKEQYEAITDALEHQASIIQMIHGEEAYEKLNQVLAAQQYTYKQQIAESQQQIEYWEELLSHMEKGSDEYKAIQERITDTQSSLNDLIETSLENLQQQYTNIVNKITDQWAFSAMGNDLDWIAQEWELINRNADYYLDDVNAAYNIQKLQADYLDMLDDATSLDVQQKITEQMNQQLGYLREKEKLSEYDVAYAQAQLEILQRQIALQEAQANKSQMKLRRDSQGNYSYVYTANEDDVKAAQGNLLDAQNNAYNLSKDQMKETQNDSISALQEAQDLISSLWTNANLTLEQKKERTQTIIDSLKEYLAGTSEQLSTSEKNIINDFIGMAEILTDENRDRMDDVYQEIINGNKDAFDQIDTRWSTSITAWLSNMEQFNNSTDDMFADLVSNACDYQTQIDDIADLVKQDFDDMSDSIQNCVDKTNDLAMSNADFIKQLREDSGVIRDYEDRLQDYASRISDAQNAMRSYQEQVNDLQGKLVAKEQENTNLTGQIQDLYNQINPGKGNGSNASGTGSGSDVIGSGGIAGYGTSDVAFGIAQNIWTYGVSGGWGNNPIRSGKLTDAYGIDFAQAVQEIINTRVAQGKEGELVDFDSKKFSSYSLIGYDTGGYTGDWGDSSGRLALLHTKELVLNQGDTDNILQAVQAVRAITSELKDNGIAQMVEAASLLVSNAGINTERFEQEVHITATFPNATSADDIREAILGLNGQVLQYAHRK